MKHTITFATEYALLVEGLEAKKRPITTIYLKYEAPIQDTYKLNTNGSVKKQPRPGRVGGVIRDHNGN